MWDADDVESDEWVRVGRWDERNDARFTVPQVTDPFEATGEQWVEGTGIVECCSLCFTFQAKAEKAVEQAQQRKQNQEAKESRVLMERVLNDNENLLIELDRERRMTESLQTDLEKNRRLVIDRDETIEELRAKLSKAESKATQCESDLSRTSTDLALERARCDALTLELHELDAIFTQVRNRKYFKLFKLTSSFQTQSTVQAFAIENEQLEEKCRDAHRTIITLNAKL